MTKSSNEARIAHLIKLVWEQEKRVKVLEEWIKDLDRQCDDHT